MYLNDILDVSLIQNKFRWDRKFILFDIKN